MYSFRGRPPDDPSNICIMYYAEPFTGKWPATSQPSFKTQSIYAHGGNLRGFWGLYYCENLILKPWYSAWLFGSDPWSAGDCVACNSEARFEHAHWLKWNSTWHFICDIYVGPLSHEIISNSLQDSHALTVDESSLTAGTMTLVYDMILLVLETEYSGFGVGVGGQYHPVDALAPKVARASAGMVLAVEDWQHVMLI